MMNMRVPVVYAYEHNGTVIVARIHKGPLVFNPTASDRFFVCELVYPNTPLTHART